MKTRMTALELILHLAEGSTTPNTLQHITKIAREALAEQPAQQEPVAITTGMALAFHRAMSDGPISDAEVKEIKHGLEAAFAHITSPQPASTATLVDVRLAQQEPMADVRAYAYSGVVKNGEFLEAVLREGAKVADGDELFTAPQPPAQPLTDEQIIEGRCGAWGEVLDPFTAGVRFSETRLGITKGGAA